MSDSEAQQKARQYLSTLSREEHMLVVLNHQLYDGDWEEMVADLQARLEGRPYVFKLASRISDDLSRIERLRAAERDLGVRLGDWVELP